MFTECVNLCVCWRSGKRISRCVYVVYRLQGKESQTTSQTLLRICHHRLEAHLKEMLLSLSLMCVSCTELILDSNHDSKQYLDHVRLFEFHLSIQMKALKCV